MMSLKHFLTLLLTFQALVSAISAQEAETNVTKEDSVLVGELNRKELQTGDFSTYFSQEYAHYKPDLQVLSKLERQIFSYDITIVMGTWCSDSREQVPRFYKILDLLNYDTRKVRLIAVDRQKQCSDVDMSSLDIELVPTFIFYKNGKEKGRIIESPEQTLEKDMQSILND